MLKNLSLFGGVKMDSLLYYIWLSLRCGAGSEAANILLSKFSSPKEVYEADRYALCEALPGRESTAKALCDKDISMAECSHRKAMFIQTDFALYRQVQSCFTIKAFFPR